VFLPAKKMLHGEPGALDALLRWLLVDPFPDFIAIWSPIYGYDPVINQRTESAVKMLCDRYEYNFRGIVLKKSHFR
jgi:hypothetical protein